jgi:hypothetical protein
MASRPIGQTCLRYIRNQHAWQPQQVLLIRRFSRQGRQGRQGAKKAEEDSAEPSVCPIGRLAISSWSDETDLSQFMHGRKNSERRDSITETILQEREQHQVRIHDIPVNKMLERYLEDAGLGSKRKRALVYSKLPLHLQTEQKKSLTGAGLRHII